MVYILLVSILFEVDTSSYNTNNNLGSMDDSRMVHYYKERALRAEKRLMEVQRLQYTNQLQATLQELEKETSNKLHLYSYNLEKTKQLQTAFQQRTHETEHAQGQAEAIYRFNVSALNDGYELDDLPAIDSGVDISSLTLGPVTPNPALNSAPTANPLPPASTKSQLRINHLNNGASGPFGAPGEYLPGDPTFSSRNLLLQEEPITNGVHNAQKSDPSAFSFGDFDINAPTSQILRSMGNKPVHSVNPVRPVSADSLYQLTVSTSQGQQSQESAGVSSLDHFSPLGAMGLDEIAPTNSSAQFDQLAISSDAQFAKWSQITAASGAHGDGWQSVSTKKRPDRPKSGVQAASNGAAAQSDSTAGERFERMVAIIQEKHRFSRPEVIAVLQVVRNDRRGDMTGPLDDLIRDADRLLAGSRNVLKSASLTARARAVAGHAEPCDNQLCPARLKLLKYRTELCLSYQTTGACHMRPGSCVYAHGEAQLRQLPRKELCERYLEGKCSNKRSIPSRSQAHSCLQCVYAHGNSELRKQKGATVGDYVKPCNSTQPANQKSRQTNDELCLTDADMDLRGEECTICLDSMSESSRRTLACGHNAFHYKCLRKWVSLAGDRSCPLCRHNTLLPEEYPALSNFKN